MYRGSPHCFPRIYSLIIFNTPLLHSRALECDNFRSIVRSSGRAAAVRPGTPTSVARGSFDVQGKTPPLSPLAVRPVGFSPPKKGKKNSG